MAILGHKLKPKVDENEEALKNGVDFEHIDFEWMCEFCKSWYQEPAGAHIANRETVGRVRENYVSRIMGMGVISGRCLGSVGKQRRELKRLGRYLANRGRFDYFREADIAKAHKLHAVIGRHCMAMEFIKHSEEGGSGDPQDDFGKFLRAIDEYLDPDAPGRRFGKSGVYDNAKLNLANNERAIPGSRGKGNDREEKGKWAEEK